MIRPFLLRSDFVICLLFYASRFCYSSLLFLLLRLLGLQRIVVHIILVDVVVVLLKGEKMSRAVAVRYRSSAVVQSRKSLAYMYLLGA